MPALTLVPPGQHRHAPWRNGGGTTAEILSEPGPDGRFAWRLSIAAVAAPGPFSDFSGYERILLPLAGNGFVLRFADGRVRRLDRLLEPFRFDGGIHVECDLVDGPVRDLNLIVARGAVRGALDVLRMTAGERVGVSLGGTVLVHLLAGAIEAGGVALAPGDTLRADGAEGERLAVAARDGSQVVVATIAPTPVLA